MTDEQLDEARAKEAMRRRLPTLQSSIGLAITAARLAREGWMPPPKVSRNLLDAREVAAQIAEGNGFEGWARAMRRGEQDQSAHVRIALLALNTHRPEGA